MIRVLVNGALGKMGRYAVEAVKKDPALQLVAETDHSHSLSNMIQQNKPEVIIDFTNADAVRENLNIIIDHDCHPVIGTTGLNEIDILDFKKKCELKKLGGIIAPNFSIAVILLMKYAQDAAQYYHQVEIIEYHHDGKLDAPSGTAIKTAQMIAQAKKMNPPKPSKEIYSGARGAMVNDIPIHAIRLPGLVAHEEIIFGGLGETLRLRHDTIDRQCFMPGLLLACKRVIGLNELVYGLEHII